MQGTNITTPKAPLEAVPCADKQMDMSRSCSTTVLTEEQPSWLEDLLSEPESPINKGHRRAASDSFASLESNRGEEELCIRSIMGRPRGFELAPYFKGQALSNRNSSSALEQQENMWKSSSSSLPLPDVPVPCKKAAEFKTLRRSFSLAERDRKTFPGSETPNQGDAASCTSEISSGGSECSQTKPSVMPSASKTEAKRKQHNARRSRLRKLQYIAELERNVQALQAQGAEASAQMEFLDQQNQLLGMENRALKQSLESLSQQHLIKSMEQELLDRELGRLQYLYHMQQQQTIHPALHRRARSHDLDSQLARLSLNPPETIATSNGFTNFPHRS